MHTYIITVGKEDIMSHLQSNTLWETTLPKEHPFYKTGFDACIIKCIHAHKYYLEATNVSI